MGRIISRAISSSGDKPDLRFPTLFHQEPTTFFKNVLPIANHLMWYNKQFLSQYGNFRIKKRENGGRGA
jgi:hypothetical protein